MEHKTITSEELTRLHELRADIIKRQGQLDDLRSASIVSASNYARVSTKGGVGDPVGRMIEAKDNVNSQLKQLRAEGRGILGNIQEHNLQRVLVLYFVAGASSWAEISHQMGKSPTYANTLYKRFKKKIVKPNIENT